MKFPKVGSRKRFLTRFKIEFVSIDLNHGKAATVDTNAVTKLSPLSGDARGNSEAATGGLIEALDDCPHRFDKTGEHDFWRFGS